ncbi:MAG TPA: cytochrome c [Burkholderiaceae bacterium]
MRSVWICAGLLLAGAAWAGDDGEGKYRKTCAGCHQADGKGIPDAFPALAGNALVQGNPRDFAAVPLTGRGGMPNFSKRLDNASLAQILNYVRNAWGNKGSTISAADVAALRAELHAEEFDGAPEVNQH